mmetsp:Transcript_9012/g.31828  ORF Transcript_9012/g.31828 Transcript_9012/m.31828 type:complete len:283 (-) Transcript_9012:186-1034(-)
MHEQHLLGRVRVRALGPRVHQPVHGSCKVARVRLHEQAHAEHQRLVVHRNHGLRLRQLAHRQVQGYQQLREHAFVHARHRRAEALYDAAEHAERRCDAVVADGRAQEAADERADLAAHLRPRGKDGLVHPVHRALHEGQLVTRVEPRCRDEAAEQTRNPALRQHAASGLAVELGCLGRLSQHYISHFAIPPLVVVPGGLYKREEATVQLVGELDIAQLAIRRDRREPVQRRRPRRSGRRHRSVVQPLSYTLVRHLGFKLRDLNGCGGSLAVNLHGAQDLPLA